MRERSDDEDVDPVNQELLGELGCDPEIRGTRDAERLFHSAWPLEGWRDRPSGERRERTEWQQQQARESAKLTGRGSGKPGRYLAITTRLCPRQQPSGAINGQ